MYFPPIPYKVWRNANHQEGRTGKRPKPQKGYWNKKTAKTPIPSGKGKKPEKTTDELYHTTIEKCSSPQEVGRESALKCQFGRKLDTDIIYGVNMCKVLQVGKNYMYFLLIGMPHSTEVENALIQSLYNPDTIRRTA